MNGVSCCLCSHWKLTRCAGETTNAVLNLVDLAGSERVNVSGTGADKERLKETQCINKVNPPL